MTFEGKGVPSHSFLRIIDILPHSLLSLLNAT